MNRGKKIFFSAKFWTWSSNDIILIFSFIQLRQFICLWISHDRVKRVRKYSFTENFFELECNKAYLYVLYKKPYLNSFTKITTESWKRSTCFIFKFMIFLFQIPFSTNVQWFWSALYVYSSFSDDDCDIGESSSFLCTHSWEHSP